MKIRCAVSAVTALLALGIFSVPAGAQSDAGAGTGQTPTSSSQTQTTVTVQTTPAHTMPGQTYHRPTHKEKFKSFAFDSFGPYAILGSALGGAIQQADNAPPEWSNDPGGWAAYGQRVANTFGINLVT